MKQKQILASVIVHPCIPLKMTSSRKNIFLLGFALVVSLGTVSAGPLRQDNGNECPNICNLVSRAEWGARPPTEDPEPLGDNVSS